MIKKQIIKIVDSIYIPLLHKFISPQTFRYGVCGGMNLVLDALLYTFFFHVLLDTENLKLGFITISPQIAAFLITFPITFFTGFWLSKYVSFEGNVGRTFWQTVRYMMVVVLNIAIKYCGLKLLVDVWSFYPSIANVTMTIVTVAVSYLMQRKFTFKV
ncbi:MAG: GtrA family protein [Rikenellaceae bacterium]